MKPATLIATICLTLVGLGHLLRVLLQIEVTAGSVVVPMWMSVVACLFCWGLAIVLWRENRKT